MISNALVIVIGHLRFSEDLVPLRAWTGEDSGHCDAEALVAGLLSLANPLDVASMPKPERRTVRLVAARS
jgi:hypothetical protein